MMIHIKCVENKWLKSISGKAISFPRIVFFMIVLALAALSCKESVSPRGPFVEKYVLYSLINFDTTFQTAYLSRNYEVNSNDPLDYTVDPAMDGAVIKLTVNNSKVYYFKEGTEIRTDTSRYKTPVKYYYIENYKPKSSDELTISALLMNGVELKSSIVVPPVSNVGFDFIYYYNPDRAKNLVMTWKVDGSNILTSNYYFAPLLEIVYSKADNPQTKIKIKTPLYFLPINETWMPIYPGVIAAGSIHYYRDSIVKILNSISEGDSLKGNYIIHDCEFSLLVMNQSIATFISAENTFMEEFSVRIEVPDYSNVENGLGIFGAYGRRKTSITIWRPYLESLGYKTSN